MNDIPIFVVWHNWNANFVDRCKTIEEAESKVRQILHAEEKDRAGIHIDLIVEGKEYRVDIVKRVAAIQLVAKE